MPIKRYIERGIEETGKGDEERAENVQQPDLIRRADEDHTQRKDGANQISAHHDAPAIEPIDHRARERREDERGQGARDDDQAGRKAGLSEIENERQNRDVVEPIAQVGDELSTPQQGELVVLAEKLNVTDGGL